MANDKNQQNQQQLEEQQWANAFNPNFNHSLSMKTHTQLMHEKEKRNEKMLETPEAQDFMEQLVEGWKEPDDQ